MICLYSHLYWEGLITEITVHMRDEKLGRYILEWPRGSKPILLLTVNIRGTVIYYESRCFGDLGKNDTDIIRGDVKK